MPEINIPNTPHRPDRKIDARTSEKRKVQWRPPSSLPTPPVNDPDWVYRWVATDVMGTPIPSNVAARIEEGWEPVNAKDYPDLVRGIRSAQSPDGHIRMGGLMLCKMSRELNDSRRAYHEEKTEAQLGDARNMVAREAKPDPTMPMTDDTVIGRGRNISGFGTGR